MGQGRIEELGEEREYTRGPTESTHLYPRRLPETEPPTKENTRAGPRPPGTYIAKVQRYHHFSFKETEIHEVG